MSVMQGKLWKSGLSSERGVAKLSLSCTRSLVIAYEPVWAIGTGKTATDEMAQKHMRKSAVYSKCLAKPHHLPFVFCMAVR